jgi:hypothetical protein
MSTIALVDYLINQSIRDQFRQGQNIFFLQPSSNQLQTHMSPIIDISIV